MRFLLREEAYNRTDRYARDKTNKQTNMAADGQQSNRSLSIYIAIKSRTEVVNTQE